MKGAGSGRGDGEVRDLKSGVVGCGSGREGPFSRQFLARFLKRTAGLLSSTPHHHTQRSEHKPQQRHGPEHQGFRHESAHSRGG